MEVSQYKNKKIFQIAKILYVTLILFALLTVATYTWFDLTTVPSVNDMSIYINSTQGMELSLDRDSEDWSTQIDFKSLIKENIPLVPITYSQADNCFFTTVYGADGRIASISQKIDAFSDKAPITNNGYYLKVSFYARSGQDVSVFLSPATEVGEGVMGAGTWLVGTPIWNSESIKHDNGGGGAEYAMRVGINITKINMQGQNTENPVFYIYEPNYDKHLGGQTGYIETFALNGNSLINKENHILQTTSTWRDADIVQKNVIISSLGEFDKEPYLFDLSPEEMAQIDLYFWLEGQDIDCNNFLNESALILSSIQFDSKAEGSSGLVQIS